MGSLRAYETKQGTRYEVRYRKPDHSEGGKRGFRTKTAAKDYLANVENAKSKGEYVDPREAKATIGELGREWLANHTHLKPSSYRPVEIAWRLHVESRWGALPAGLVRFSDVQRWVRQEVGHAVLRAYGVLAAILDAAVRDRRMLTNPAPGGEAAAEATEGAQVSDPRGRFRPGLGVRRQGGVRVDPGLLRSAVGRGDRSTGQGLGHAPSSDQRHSQRRRGGREDRGWDAEDAQEAVGAVPAYSRPALGSSMRGQGAGRPGVLRGRRSAHAQNENERGIAGLVHSGSEEAGLPVMTPHAIRHTAASLAVSSGANVKSVQRILGHASAAMTLDVYSDLFDDELDAVAGRLDDGLARTVVGEMWAEGGSGQ